jgi:hypothetical protein
MVLEWMLDRMTYTQASEVQNDVNSFHRIGNMKRVGYVPQDELEAVIVFMVPQVLQFAGRQIVEYGDGALLVHESVHQMGPDETGSAGDQKVLSLDIHAVSP